MKYYCAYCFSDMRQRTFDTESGCTDLCTERLRTWNQWIKRTQSPEHPMFHGDVNKPYKATAALRLPPLNARHAAQTVAFARYQTELALVPA